MRTLELPQWWGKTGSPPAKDMLQAEPTRSLLSGRGHCGVKHAQMIEYSEALVVLGKTDVYCTWQAAEFGPNACPISNVWETQLEFLTQGFGLAQP